MIRPFKAIFEILRESQDISPKNISPTYRNFTITTNESIFEYNIGPHNTRIWLIRPRKGNCAPLVRSSYLEYVDRYFDHFSPEGFKLFVHSQIDFRNDLRTDIDVAINAVKATHFKEPFRTVGQYHYRIVHDTEKGNIREIPEIEFEEYGGIFLCGEGGYDLFDRHWNGIFHVDTIHENDV